MVKGEWFMVSHSTFTRKIWHSQNKFLSLQWNIKKKYLKNMATIALENETNSYWNLIKGAGNEVKLALIKRLSDAVLPAVSRTKSRKSKYTADEFAGIWSDEEYMDAEEMVKVIRDGRHIDSSRNTILL